MAGAVATGTHGAGQTNAGLASAPWAAALEERPLLEAVMNMELVDGRGRIVHLEGPALREASVHLGCLGVVTSLTLRVVPQFELRQRCFALRLSQISSQQALDSVLGAGYSVSLFTDWAETDVERLGWFESINEGLRRPAGSGCGSRSYLVALRWPCKTAVSCARSSIA